MRISRIVFVGIWLAMATMVAYSQTAQYLHAKVLDNAQDLPVQLSANKSQVEWEPVRNRSFGPIAKDELLLVHSGFKVGYFKYNPLSVKLSVNAVDVDDPAQKALGSLLDALKSVGTTIGGAQLAADKTLAQHNVLGFDGSDSGKKASEALNNAIKNAGAVLDGVKSESQSWGLAIDTLWGGNGATGPLVIAAAIANVDELLKAPDNKKCEKADLERGVKPLGVDCVVDLLGKYDDEFKALGSLNYDDTVLIQKMGNLHAKALEVQTELNAFKSSLLPLLSPNVWSPDGRLFLVDPSIEPTLQTAKNVTITVTPLSLDETKLSLTDGKAVQVTFNARVYRALFPEAGVGAVFGFIERPKYGTSTDANGKTVVSLASKDNVSVDPAVMVNFVCRCDAGGIAPMLQVGAATSKDLPAVLLGGGLRLFQVGGKGDIALGGGLLLGWFQDLQKLKVGDVVKGTADITADLGYIKTPQPAPYFTIQYKF
jgi:hypothetical protein